MCGGWRDTDAVSPPSLPGLLQVLEHTMKLVVSLFCLALCGCAWTDPGGQVRRGLEQRTLKEWRADGGFWAEGVGTQTESYTMAQGHLVLNEDGTINTEKSVLEYYLKADPSADAAGTALGQALIASTEQAKAMSSVIESLASMVTPLLTPVPVGEAVP